MILQDVYDQLMYGELQGHKLSELTTSEELRDTAKAAINSHINMGLTELYTEFPLKTGYVTIEVQEGVEDYLITSNNSQANEDATGVKFIVDTVDNPFSDDIIRINTFTDEKGRDVEFNSSKPAHFHHHHAHHSKGSVRLIEYNRVLIKDMEAGSTLKLSYRAKHAKLSSTEDTSTAIVLPTSHLQALLYFIGFRVYSAMAGVEHASKSSQFYQLYTQEKTQIKQQSLHTSITLDEPNKFRNRGFV